MKYRINGTVYEFDWQHATVRDWMALKSVTGLNRRPFATGFDEGDPACMAAVAWLLLSKAGEKGPDGQPIQFKDVDFDVNEFLADEEEPEEQPDPTPGEPSTSLSDSTSPEPSTSTD